MHENEAAVSRAPKRGREHESLYDTHLFAAHGREVLHGEGVLGADQRVGRQHHIVLAQRSSLSKRCDTNEIRLRPVQGRTNLLLSLIAMINVDLARAALGELLDFAVPLVDHGERAHDCAGKKRGIVQASTENCRRTQRRLPLRIARAVLQHECDRLDRLPNTNRHRF